MPDTYRVAEVAQAEQWSNQHGQFQPYDMKLDGIEGVVQINRKLRDGQVPPEKVVSPGQSLFLSLTQTEHGWRAKEEMHQDGNGQPQMTAPVEAPQTGGEQYARRPDHPENVARMRHAAALAAAPGYYELFRTEDVLPKADSLEKAKANLEGIMGWLEGTYPANQSADEDIPF